MATREPAGGAFPPSTAYTAVPAAAYSMGSGPQFPGGWGVWGCKPPPLNAPSFPGLPLLLPLLQPCAPVPARPTHPVAASHPSLRAPLRPLRPHHLHHPPNIKHPRADYRRTVALKYVSRGLQVAFSYVSLTILALPFVSFGAVRGKFLHTMDEGALMMMGVQHS